MQPLRWQPPVEFSIQEEQIVRRIRKAKFLVFLRPHRHILFDEPFQEELANLYRKDTRPRELAKSIRKAARGESVLHSRIAARMIQEVREAKRKVPPAFAELTPRELEVLQLLADGQTNAVIAEQLVLSEKTVRGYVSNILSKLHLEDRTQVAVFAWQQGLMERG